MLRSVAVSLCCACITWACVGDSSSSSTLFAPTLLTADPVSFLGNVRCGSEVRKYVVTLFDVSSGTEVDLGSAPPTECTTPTTFGAPKIKSGSLYVAEIDGYDRDDIVPEGGNDSGSRVMTDPTTMARVFPRWTTTCGEIRPPADAQASDAPFNPLRFPTIPLQNIEVTFHGCLPFRAAELPDAGDVEAASPDGPADATMTDTSNEPPADASGAGDT